MKRGQGNAAVGTVFILAILVLIYMLLLPAGERARLLGDGGGQQPPGQGPPGAGPSGTVLLSQNVGRVFPPQPNEVEHSIPSFTIFTETNAEALLQRPSLDVRNSAFGEQQAVMNFSYDPDVSDVKLSFNVKSTSGRLIVTLNGDEIFNQAIENPTVEPIPLPDNMLERDNQLVFRASSPGLAFWGGNSHDLRNVIVSGEVTDRSGSQARQHFTIPQSEYRAMEYAELSFLPNCEPEGAGRLRVTLNAQEVYSGYADCGVPNTVELAKEIVEPGDNTLRFVSEQGQYLVDLVKVTSKMQGQEAPVFYFNLQQSVYDRLYVNDALLFVTLRFTQRGPKQGTLNINGFEETFRTDGIAYQTQVNPDFLMPGPNSVMIRPQGGPLDIAELRVELR